MDTKEEKKERKQSYFARLKKKKQAKQNAETASAVATRTHTGKEDNNTVVLEPDKCNIAVEEEYMTDEKKKRKSNQLKEIRRTELKRYYSIGEYSWRYCSIFI
uniref:Isoform 6 of Nuclear receptor coactivator 7 n=1 Tax=Homo sapiens TaxID=9606 RepID=Q8NI08-6